MPPAPKRSLFGRLLLLFTIVPIVELTLLVWLGGRIGFWPTVGLIAGTAVLGSYLAHREGLSVLARFRARVASGGMPGSELSDGLIVLVSGAFLLTPGVLTDVVGFLGLFAPTRAVIRRIIARRFRGGMLGGSVHLATWPPASPPQDDLVDVDYEEVTHDASPHDASPHDAPLPRRHPS